ncbi:MAG: hypothetical protein WBM08_10095, partial [Prochlorococcaceae cyanobacterium]
MAQPKANQPNLALRDVALHNPALRSSREGSLELFERNWRAYRAVVDHDLMEHRALTDALKA